MAFKHNKDDDDEKNHLYNLKKNDKIHFIAFFSIVVQNNSTPTKYTRAFNAVRIVC